MPDGVTLLTDRYWARGRGREPVILMRSPYGRDSLWALAAAALRRARLPGDPAELPGHRRFRGRLRRLPPRGAGRVATLAWIAGAAVVLGKIAMAGPSYLGIVAVGGRDRPAAVAPRHGRVDLVSPCAGLHVPRGTFSLDSTLPGSARWQASVVNGDGPRSRSARRSAADGAGTVARSRSVTPIVAVTGARVAVLSRTGLPARKTMPSGRRSSSIATLRSLSRPGDDGHRLVRHVPARATRGLSGAPRMRRTVTPGSPSAPGSTPTLASRSRHCATRWTWFGTHLRRR